MESVGEDHSAVPLPGGEFTVMTTLIERNLSCCDRTIKSLDFDTSNYKFCNV